MNISDLQKACVVLGAGASCDVWSEGTPRISGHIAGQDAWRPPLARELFDTNARPAFWDVMKLYPGAKYLSDLLYPVIVKGEIAIEEELRRYAKHDDADLQEKFKHVPPYLRDLLWECSHNYVEEPGSYKRLITELLAEQPHNVLFLTLNYDNLLEKALTLLRGWTFRDRGDYFRPGRQANVVKLHGSINWFIRIGEPNDGQSPGWDQCVREFDIIQRPSEIIVRNDIGTVRNFHNAPGLLYPWITAPLARKDPSDVRCLDSEIKATKEFLHDCRKFLIVGTSGLDDDLTEILQEAVANSPVPPFVHFVAGGKTSEVWQQFKKKIPAFNSLHSSSLVNRNIRFRQYLDQDLHKDFAGADLPI